MDSTQGTDGKESMVDPFLVEALQNPRHRLTILRMELDIQRFLQNPDQHQFEFQHFPTSYLRLAAHRVAQHYGLVTMVQDNGIDGMMNKIVAQKTPESKYPAVCLSQIPAKQLESDKAEQVKIVIRPRPKRGSTDEYNELGRKQDLVKSVEERKEEYDKARARIFSCPGSPNSEDGVSQVSSDTKSSSSSKDEVEAEMDKNVFSRDTGSSRVAILRDREKDLTDPDYDRSYDRYVRSLPANQSFAMAPFHMQKVQLPFVQYEPGIPQYGHMPRNQPSIGYCPQTAAYVQWPSAAMVYAHSYNQFRQVAYQAPFCQQPLSFDYSQTH